MRIALFLPHLGVSGGLGVYCRSLLAGLLSLEEDDAYHVLAPAEPRKLFPYSGLDEGWRELAADPRVRYIPLDWPTNHPLALALDQVLAAPLKQLQSDLVHGSYYTGMVEPPCPQLVTFHDAGFMEFPQLFGDTARQRRETLVKVAPMIDRLVCISADARERICRLLPFDVQKAVVVHLALSDSAEALERARQPESARRPLWPGGDAAADWGSYFFLPVGAGTGFNRPRKNVPLAVAAFRMLQPTPVKLIIASTGILHPKLLAELLPESEIATGKVVGDAWRSADDAIRLLPNLERDDFLAGMAHARAVVYPSRYEGFGLPTIEAMALEVPLIACRATSIPEVAGDAGILVDPEDPAAFAAACRRVLQEPAFTADLISRGKEQAARFTIRKMGERMHEVYGQVVKGA